MTIKELKKLKMNAMKAKDKETTGAYTAILGKAALIAKDDKNREITDKDIVAAAKKELKEQIQSKDAGAPFSEITVSVCESILPKTMSERETETAVDAILVDIENPTMKDMGKIMGTLTKEYGDTLDKALVSKIVKSKIN